MKTLARIAFALALLVSICVATLMAWSHMRLSKAIHRAKEVGLDVEAWAAEAAVSPPAVHEYLAKAEALDAQVWRLCDGIFFDESVDETMEGWDPPRELIDRTMLERCLEEAQEPSPAAAVLANELWRLPRDSGGRVRLDECSEALFTAMRRGVEPALPTALEACGARPLDTRGLLRSMTDVFAGSDQELLPIRPLILYSQVLRDALPAAALAPDQGEVTPILEAHVCIGRLASGLPGIIGYYTWAMAWRDALGSVDAALVLAPHADMGAVEAALSDIDPFTELGQALREEARFGWAAYDWFENEVEGAQERTPIQHDRFGRLLWFIFPRWDRATYLRAMADSIDRVQRLRESGEYVPMEPIPPEIPGGSLWWANPIAVMMLSPDDPAKHAALLRAEIDLALVALEASRAGRPTAAELERIVRSRKDVFGRGGSLRWRDAGGGVAALYSVGPDGEDDGAPTWEERARQLGEDPADVPADYREYLRTSLPDIVWFLPLSSPSAEGEQ